MKALQVIDKSFLGGGQTVVRYLVEGLRGSGVETLLSCRDGGPLVDSVRALGTPVLPVPFDKRFRPGPARALARIARERGVDVVHGHGLVATFYCVLARRFFGLRAPILYHQHGFHHHNYGRLARGARIATEKWVCGQVDRVIACSTMDRDQLVHEGYASPESVRLLYYGVPEPRPSDEQIRAAAAEAGVEPGRPVVGLVARLHPQKGVDVFLRAAAEMRRRRPDAAFVVVGTGELEGELHRLGADLGLNGELRWVGARPSSPFLPLFTVNVLSSRWEGLPFTLLEAMASRKAIVTTDVPGCLEAVGPSEASIVPRDDPAALAGAALDLLDHPEQADAQAAAARRRYESAFTLSEMARRVEELYVEVCR
jgi:glycosyltransferase involved in cell wall biosynthesis